WSGTLGAVAPERTVSEALRVATAPLPGAVHLDHDPSTPGDVPPPPVEPRSPTSADVERARALLARAQRPVAIVGGGAWAAAGGVRRRAAAPALPARPPSRGAGTGASETNAAAGLFPNGASEQPLLDEADMIVAIGLDPVEPIPTPWQSSAPIVAIHPVPL